jgi:hypothetical protein
MAAETTHLLCAYCLREDSRTPAVTAVSGTLLCSDHALAALADPRMRHD